MSFKPSILFLSVLSFHLSLNAATTAQTKQAEAGDLEASREVVLTSTTDPGKSESTPNEETSNNREVVAEESVVVPEETSMKRSVADSESVAPSSKAPHSSAATKAASSKPAPSRTKASRSTSSPSGPSQGQKMEKHEALRHLSERVADLFACVPAYKDTDYSTQSWYLVDTFKAWNNAIADSVFDSSDDIADLKGLFESQAMAALNRRNPSLAASPEVMSYIQDAALAAETIYKNTRSTKHRSNSFSETTKLLQNSSRAGGKNIFQYLKAAHSSSVAEVKKSNCAQLGKNFFSTPTFKAQALSKNALVAHKISDRPKFIRDAQRAENKHLQNDDKINAAYPRSKFVTAQLPIATAQNMKSAGYYSAGQFRAGRPHIIGNLLKAANRLKAEGIYMGIGDINQLGAEGQKKVKTPGFKNRDTGTRATLMTQSSNGNPSSCDKFAPPCYDYAKTLKMLKTLIDRDPDNITRIEINDEPMRLELQNYLVTTHGYKKMSADWIIRENKEYANVISYEWYH